MRLKIFIFIASFVQSISAAFTSPSPTPKGDLTRTFKGIEIVLEKDLVRNSAYKDIFVRAVATVAVVPESSVRNFKFHDKGSDQLLQLLEGRNMSLYDISFQITVDSRETMNLVIDRVSDAVETSDDDTGYPLIDAVNRLIVDSLFVDSDGIHDTGEFDIYKSEFVTWTRNFTRTEATCYWPLGEFSLLLPREASEIQRMCESGILDDGVFTIIMLSGLNALVVQARAKLTGPVLTSVPLGTLGGTIESEESETSDGSTKKASTFDSLAIIFSSLAIVLFLLIVVICTVRYVRRLARKDHAAMSTIKRQEMQIRRMRDAWMLDWYFVPYPLIHSNTGSN